jgi:hypothetical protein
MQIEIKDTYNAFPPKILVHGGEKVGKSTFANGSPGALFLPTEEGLKGLHSKSLVVKGKSRLESLEEFEFMLAYCEQNPNAFQSLVIDSADWLEQLIVEWLCKKYNKSNVAECAGGFGKGYLVLMNKWNEILQKLDRINRLGKFIIITCHSKAVLFNDPLGEPYDLWTMKLYSPKGQNGSLELLKEWVDVIGFAMVEKFVSETESTKALEKGEKKHRAIETGKRLLQYETSQAYLAGNRYGIKKPTELNWSAFINALMETQNKQTK